MYEITRVTRQCSLDSLNPELSKAIRAHIAYFQLGDIESSVTICCETTSTRQKKGLFPGKETTVTSALITPQWLIWSNGTSKKHSTGSAQLRNIDVRDYEATAMYNINPDAGLNITGRYTDVTQQGEVFIGLSPEADGQLFRAALREAISNALK